MVFRDARLKIDRANEHIAQVTTRITLLHTTDTAIVEVNPETGGETLKHDFGDITAFDDIALMVGDAVHNLNCALDYTWLQTIERLIPALVDDRAKFPVRKTINEVEGWLTKAEVNISCPDLHRFMLDKIQPCEGRDNAIWTIHNFDIRDKHRLLIPVLSRGHIEGIEVQDEAGETWPGSAAGDFQRPPYFIDFKRGLHVKKKGKLTASIAIEDGQTGYHLRVPDTLIAYSYFILRVVESFEAFLESQVGG